VVRVFAAKNTVTLCYLWTLCDLAYPAHFTPGAVVQGLTPAVPELALVAVVAGKLLPTQAKGLWWVWSLFGSLCTFWVAALV